MPQANFKTEQEAFWAGEFGDKYTFRNDGADMLAANAALFTKVFARTGKPKSIIEFGCNQGMNLKAIATLLPDTKLTGIEINETAADKLERDLGIRVHNTSIIDFEVSEEHDLAMIKGVLIHISPDELTGVYDKLHAASSEYIFVCEYYNQTPVAISYQGHDDKLFKRDFAGEMLERFPDLELVDYGFCYRHDPAFPMDDVTWFLMRKSG